MAERKVLNKYIPPDFDPAKIPRLRLGKSRQIKVRLMAPFSMRCETCGQWIGKGTKFNARKESVEGEKFHSIQIYRFYIRCQRCAAEITFKTDPENINYEVEKGALRNFEPWREEKALNEEQKQTKDEEEENNPIKALENRTEQSRREMDIMDALDEIRTQNAKGERVAEADVLEAIANRGEEEEALRRLAEEEEDEQLAKLAFQTAGGRRIKRACEEDAIAHEREIKMMAVAAPQGNQHSGARGKLAVAPKASVSLGIKGVKVKAVAAASAPPPPPTLAGMLGAYGSDNDDSSEDD
ncbi:Pre-mRNA-splicing factor cwf16 [Coemansia sp. RSA 376]|nr:Pre-mRNA-splicing factor cwf16 [Coemansia sp. S680]KAJ2034780.1 Pre-mRNA-splicing factor cwf16 [Coemansia sp. S3946]KAJ2066432.1 Pre-mRNA-splicing factor cwf16 [Coemansia sp. S2]KAJ2260522.1 Pre-mRNA-splicing factor cwf16 [Coemansia sp. RSA 376]KAJ2344286.1 Pre-mRNA-splicing factor cwf16 [Coemansia sp. RSA 2673]